MGDGGLCIIDEFQRMDRVYWDRIAFLHGSRGRLILCGSSLGIMGRVFDRNSPLPGLFTPFHVDLVSPGDVVTCLANTLDPVNAIKWGVIVRDPWILGLIEPRGDPVDTIASYSTLLTGSVRGLIGEVFHLEDRKLTRLYDTVLYLLSRGYWSSQAIAQKLYEHRLIASYNPGIVTGVLNQLISIGLVEKIPLWRTRGARAYYHHRSPLTAILYSVLDIVDTGIGPSREDILSVYSIELRFFIGELLARAYGYAKAYTILPRGAGDIDIVLLDKRSRKPVIAYEIKTGRITRGEARRAIERIRSMGIPRAGLISLTEKPEYPCDHALGPQDLVGIANKLYRMERKYAEKLAQAKQ